MSTNSSCVCYTEYVYKVVDAAKYEITDYKINNNNINYNSANLAYKRTIDRSTNQQCNHLDPAYRFYRTTSEYAWVRQFYP